MKTFFLKNGLLIAFITIFIAIFAIGGSYSRFMTEQHDLFVEEVTFDRTVAPYLAMFDGADSATEFMSAVGSKTYELVDLRGTFEPTIAHSYHIFAGTEEVGIVYVVNSFGKFAGLQMAYAIDTESDSCIGVLMVANSETPTYFQNLDADFYAQFDAFGLTELALNVDAVAGSTYSSKGIEIGLLYAREA
jgi:hypothetical protein